jgi:hypothetical protein
MMPTPRHQAAGFVPWPFHADGAVVCAQSLEGAWETGAAVARWPFDAMRAQHAAAVHAGLIRNSLLESRDFEQTLDAIEKLTLGPLARSV